MPEIGRGESSYQQHFVISTDNSDKTEKYVKLLEPMRSNSGDPLSPLTMNCKGTGVPEEVTGNDCPLMHLVG